MIKRCLLVFVVGLLPACRSHILPPDLGLLYDRVAAEHHESRNPVILIPGILGSTLAQEETGRVVWGAFEGDYANPKRADGARLIALPMREGAPLSDLRDDVIATGALESLRLRLFGIPLGVSAYVNILVALGIGGFRDQQLGLAGAVDYGDDHFTCFQFAYDWRMDLAANAARFHDFVEEKKRYVREETQRRYGYDVPDMRFDVVAHSMGGLLLRYYLRYGASPLGHEDELPPITWAGARNVERAVLVGTPNAGSGQAFRQLTEGTKLGPFLPRYRAGLLGTMPAVYQLLPRPRHGFWQTDGGDTPDIDWLAVETWERYDWGLLNPKEDGVLEDLLPDAPDASARRAIARDHIDKCLRQARRFFRAMDVPATPPAPTELHLVVGDAVETLAGVWVDPDSGEWRSGEVGPGDGTVLRSSVLMDERQGGEWSPVLSSPITWDRVLFFFEDHLGLTRSPAFIDNLLFLLLEEPRR